MYLTNQHLYTDHAVSQKSLPTPRIIDPTGIYYACGLCPSVSAEPTTKVRRTFDTVEACPDCVEKIAIGKRQVAAYLANRITTCECGHEKNDHFGERGSGGCSNRFDGHTDVACTCDGYWRPEFAQKAVAK